MTKEVEVYFRLSDGDRELILPETEYFKLYRRFQRIFASARTVPSSELSRLPKRLTCDEIVNRSLKQD